MQTIYPDTNSMIPVVIDTPDFSRNEKHGEPSLGGVLGGILCGALLLFAILNPVTFYLFEKYLDWMHATIERWKRK